MEQLFNATVALFIVLTMASAGFTTTFDQVRGVARRPVLILSVLLVGIVLRPLIGWGAAEVFGLAIPGFIALVVASSAPGSPFGAKLIMIGRTDVASGAVLQVMLAIVMSFTFAPAANAIISAADLGPDLTLPVADILKVVVVLQLLPFLIGILMRHWTEETALQWNAFATKGSSVLFLAVFGLALVGGWQAIIDIIGDRVLLATMLVSGLLLVVGYFVSSGETSTRRATALIEPMSNAGPCFAAIAIAFDNDPTILGATVGIVLVQLIIGIGVASFFGRDAQPKETSS